MTATASSRYRVIVSPSPRVPGRLEYELARASTQGELMRGHPVFGDLAGGADAGRPVWDPLEPLTSPECTQAQAREFALAWLRLTRPEPVPEHALEFRFLEPSGPAAGASGTVHYGTVGRPRRWWGIRRKAARRAS